MKILTNKDHYEELPIDTKWKVKAISDNPYFSREEYFKIIGILPCKRKERARCVYRPNFSPYYDKIRKSLEETCAGISIGYKYEGTDINSSQCYHTFIEGAEQKD